MNAERLRELAKSLVERDAEYSIQAHLNNLTNSIQDLANNPSDTGSQSSFAAAREQFRSAMARMLATITPAQEVAIEQLRGRRFFTEGTVEEIERTIDANTMTPHVAAGQIGALREARTSYLDVLRQLDVVFEALGIEASSLQPGEVELGFLLPRDLFHNRFDEMVKELDRLNKIIASFAEAVLGTADEVEVHQISTSDPTFFLGMNVTVAIEIAKTVAEFIGALKAVSEISKALGIVKTLDLDDKITAALDAGTKQIVEKQIAKRVDELLDGRDEGDGRSHEVRNSLERAMSDLFARVERGMTVEIRLLPPVAEQVADDGAAAETNAQFAELKTLATRLERPKQLTEPLLKLTHADNDD